MRNTILKYKLHFAPFLLFTGFLLFLRLLLLKSYSVDLDGLEYYFLNITHRVLDAQPLYTDPQSYPYSNCLYTPVYFYVYGSILSFFKMSFQQHIHEMLVIGRILSLVLIFIFLRYLKKITALFQITSFEFTILLTLAILQLTGHIYAVRPDALKLLFFALFYYSLLQYLFYSKHIKYGVLAVLFAVLAVYTKQDIAAHILICLALCCYQTRSRKAFMVLGSFLAISFLVFVILLLRYKRIIIDNLFLFNIQSITNYTASYNIYFLFLSLVRTAPLLLITFRNQQLLKNTEGNGAEKFIVLSTIVLYVFIHSSLLRPGANLNYTYEVIFCLLLNLAIYMRLKQVEIQNEKRKYGLYLITFVSLLLLSNVILQTYTYNPQKHEQLKAEYERCMKDRETLRSIIKNDTIFFPNTKYSIFYSDFNVVLGHDMHLDRFINLYTDVYLQSKLPFIDTAPYDANFTNGKVKYILVEKNTKSMQHVQDYYPKYKPDKTSGNFYIYRFVP